MLLARAPRDLAGLETCARMRYNPPRAAEAPGFGGGHS